MKKEEFVPLIESIISSYSKERLINVLMALADEANEEEQEKIQRVLFGKMNLKTLNDLKKAHHELEVEDIKRETKKVLDSLNRIKKEKLTIVKEINYDYDDWYQDSDEEFIYSDPNLIMDAIKYSSKVLEKGIELGLTHELLGLVNELISFSADEDFEDGEEIVSHNLYQLCIKFDYESLFKEIDKSIYYVSLFSLSPIEAANNIMRFINIAYLSLDTFKKFLYENLYRIDNLDEFIFSFASAFCMTSDKEGKYFFMNKLEDIFDIFDLVNNKNKLKEVLLELSKVQSFYLVYLLKNFGYQFEYLNIALEFLKSTDGEQELKEVISNLLLPSLEKINDEELKYEFVKYSFFANPSIETYKNLMINEKEDTKDLVYNLISKRIYSVDSENENNHSNYHFGYCCESVNYIFLLLLNKKEEFFNCLRALKEWQSINKEILEILINVIVKENTEYPVIETLKTIPFDDVICKFSVRYLNRFYTKGDKYNLMNYIKENVSFDDNEIRKIYKIIENHTSKYVENITTYKERSSYAEGAFLIHLVDELNAYINKGCDDSIIRKYLNMYQRFRALVREINDGVYASPANLINKYSQLENHSDYM